MTLLTVIAELSAVLRAGGGQILGELLADRLRRQHRQAPSQVIVAAHIQVNGDNFVLCPSFNQIQNDKEILGESAVGIKSGPVALAFPR